MRSKIREKIIRQFTIRITVLVGLFSANAPAANLQWRQHDAEVWQREQIISGKLDTLVTLSGTLNWNEGTQAFDVDPTDSSFCMAVQLNEGENWFVAAVDSQGVAICSDTLRLQLRLPLKPVLEAYPTVIDREVTFHGRVIENPDFEEVTFTWTEDEQNPSLLGLNGTTGSVTVFNLPEQVPGGEYYFDLAGVTSGGDTARARTFVTVKADSIYPFDIRRDHAAWIDSAIIYEITPYIFVAGGQFLDIREKLPELKELGVNTIWLQPVYKNKEGGQGYDILNYFEVRNDCGGAEKLNALIERAHSLGMRVLFDISIGHTSIYHRYAQHSLEYNTASHYYHYYQREEDDAAYSQHYSHYKGFINYFWDDLPILNYDNQEVRNWMLTACKYWIEKYDIDGYRFDAVWGVTARRPEFTQDLRLALKRIKPEIMLLAEDKASWPNVFDKRFDVAFDWAPGEGWVSQWYWETDYVPWYTNNQYTIFNTGSPQDRADKLRSALTNRGQGYAKNAKILRYMGNNDMIPFIRNHGLARTKMVTTLVFALNGIPLIYNGQEIGHEIHPYYTYSLFQRNSSIRSQDELGLFPFYRYLIQLRREYAALRSANIREVHLTPEDNAYAFHRWEQNQNLFGVINMMNETNNITLELPVDELALDSSRVYYLSDLIGGTIYSGTGEGLANVDMTIPGYTTCLFLLADSAIQVSTQPESTPAIVSEMSLSQNYPNPFNAATTIAYTIPQKGNVELIVLDMLGREVDRLVNQEQAAGEYRVQFSADRLASGCYFYRLKYGNKTHTGKMLLMK